MSFVTHFPVALQAGLVFLVGLMIGSFANVCIHRIPLQESVVFPASHCPHCAQAVRPQDNIPVLSYILLKGKCRHCQEPISIVYPIVETVTAILLTLLFVKFGWSWKFLIYSIVTPALVIINLIDLQHQIIPDKITLPGILFGFACGFYLNGLWSTALGLLLGGGLFLLLGQLWWWLFQKEGMGGGDIKYMAAVGALIGWQAVLLNIFLASLAGAGVGMALIVLKKREWSDKIPFGVYLTAGTYVAIGWGDELIHWYLRGVMGL